VAIMAGLKAATAEHHERLERRVDIAARLRSRDAYRELLERFYGYYRPLEARLAPHGQTFPIRPKAPLLARDIEALGGDVAALPLARRLPPTDSLEQALGVLYVLEGATLGGAVIARMARGLDVSSQFFGAYDSARWREFKAFVDQHGADSAAAVATFETMEAWVCA
jgi:heme oxygenase